LKQNYDVIIVGAGPAGAMLAYKLARKGIEVLLLEKERLPRYKCCAGGVTSKARDLLDFDISEVVEDVVHDVNFSYKLGSHYPGHYSQPLIYTVMRDAFDHLLVKRAQQSGAMVIDKQEVKQIQTQADGVEISTGDSIFRSRVVAGADGAYSVVARELGLRRNIEYTAGIERELVVSEEQMAKWKSRVEIDMGSISGCYAWVFPKRNLLSTGAICPTHRARSLRRYYQKFLSSLSINNYTISKASSHLIPTYGGKTIIFQDKVLLLGDAAGLADPLTGEGIYNAIQSAGLAAGVIENSLAQNRTELQDYQRAVEEKIMSEMRIAHTLSKLFARFPHLAFRMLKSDSRVWRTCCYLLRGETNYAIIKERIGGFKGMFAFLSRVY